MKKRLLSVLLCLCMVLMLFPAEALAAESDTDIPYAVTGGSIYFDAATGTITGCDESVTEAEIPSTINGVAVTGIASNLSSRITRSALRNHGSKTRQQISIADRAYSLADRLRSLAADCRNPYSQCRQ